MNVTSNADLAISHSSLVQRRRTMPMGSCCSTLAQGMSKQSFASRMSGIWLRFCTLKSMYFLFMILAIVHPHNFVRWGLWKVIELIFQCFSHQCINLCGLSWKIWTYEFSNWIQTSINLMSLSCYVLRLSYLNKMFCCPSFINLEKVHLFNKNSIQLCICCI